MKDIITKNILMAALILCAGLFSSANSWALTFEEENLLIFPRGNDEPSEPNHAGAAPKVAKTPNCTPL